jgi:hypothetical protein
MHDEVWHAAAETGNSWEYCRQWIARVEPFFVCILGHDTPGTAGRNRPVTLSRQVPQFTQTASRQS